MIPYLWIEQARERIAAYIRETPLTFDSVNNLYFKWENQQITGSFKIRGALNKVLSLEDWELERGLVTASAGNHGQGVAFAGQIRRIKVVIFASEHAAPNKIRAMQELGAKIELVEGGYAQAENAGIDFASQTGATWISPYNDGTVIAGQATLALEVLQQMPDAASLTWVVPVGGGGLVSGIGSVLQSITNTARLVAVQSEASSFMYNLFHRGTQIGVSEAPSLADGLSGPVESGSVTIPMVKKCVDDFVLVTEDDIRCAIQDAWIEYHERIEGSGAVPLAAILTGRISAKPALLVVTGGNIDPIEHESIVADRTKNLNMD